MLPDDYRDYQACRLYGCTPSQLDAEDVHTVLLHLAFAGVEQHLQQLRQNKGTP